MEKVKKTRGIKGYVVNCWGIDGAKYIGYKSGIKESGKDGYWDRHYVFQNEADAKKYDELCNRMSSYYTGDPDQDYTPIEAYQKLIGDFLKKTKHKILKGIVS